MEGTDCADRRKGCCCDERGDMAGTAVENPFKGTEGSGSDREDNPMIPLCDPNSVIGPLLHSAAAVGGIVLHRALRKGKVFEAPWEGGIFKVRFSKLLKWKSSFNTPSDPSPKKAAILAPTIPRMALESIAHPPLDEPLQATWMGHASFLVQTQGINILTDPIWSDRASIVQFSGPKRYVKPPIQLEDLPCPIHIVTISHNHYDHLDGATVKKLQKLFDPIFVVPLGMKTSWFKPLWEKEKPGSYAKVHELDWWHCVSLKIPVCVGSHPSSVESESSIHITAVPVQHWTLRSGFDRNQQLWCGFVYEVERNGSLAATAEEEESLHAEPEAMERRNEEGLHQSTDNGAAKAVYRLFYAGDTGYCPVFKDIGNIFQHFDFCMLPIGAYEPRWFMNVQHIGPEEAVQIHEELHRPTLSCGMHWGTFVLTDEPLDEPPKLLKQTLEAKGLPQKEFISVMHGETFHLPKVHVQAEAEAEEKDKKDDHRLLQEEEEGERPTGPVGRDDETAAGKD